ncbi:hypothetical protein V1517DRAFT_321644 [Lipomyces orientalis]|uniref:Uncharacterized protein n=1 Tax=Lipomyces orientalis TaxID=1233043 RepID=A0ACC3TPG9_9ASCO
MLQNIQLFTSPNIYYITMARLRKKYPPKRALPQAAYQLSPNAILPTYVPRDSSSTSARPSPSPSLLQPLLSNTSSSSSVSTSSARVNSGSVGSLGVVSASSGKLSFNRAEAGNETYPGPAPPYHVVGSPLVRRKATPDGRLHAASFVGSRIMLPGSQHHLAPLTAADGPGPEREVPANIGGDQYSFSTNTKARTESTRFSSSSTEKISSILSRKVHRRSTNSILGLGSSSAVIAALTNRHRQDL